MLQPHIQLGEDLGVKYAILPGDPARVGRVAQQLENPRELAFNREYRSIKGTYKGIPVLAMSTGMGGPSVAIAVEELKNIGVTHLIRIGRPGRRRLPHLCAGAVPRRGRCGAAVRLYPQRPGAGAPLSCGPCPQPRQLLH